MDEKTENGKVSSEIVNRDGSPLDVPLIQFAWDKKEEMHVYLGEKTKEEKKTQRK